MSNMECQLCCDDTEVTELPCKLHMVCVPCVEKLYDMSSDSSKYECPFCKKEFDRPSKLEIVSKVESPCESVLVKEETNTERQIKLLVHKGRNLLVIAKQKIEQCSVQQWNNRRNEELVEERIEELKSTAAMIENIEDRAQRKITALREATEQRIHQSELRESKLKTAVVRHSALVDKVNAMVDKFNCNENRLEAMALFEKLQSSVAELENLFNPPGAVKLEVGDSVCLNLSVEQLMPDFLLTEVTHESIGFINQCCEDRDQYDVIFKDYSSWSFKVAQLVPAYANHTLPARLDRVQIRSDIKDPHFGWQMVQHSSVGTLKNFVHETVMHGRVAEVDFPGNHQYRCLYGELELAPARTLQKGDAVCLSVNEKMPAESHNLGTGSLVGLKYDKAEVKFSSGKKWKGSITRIKHAFPISVGDRVRVKQPVNCSIGRFRSVTIYPTDDNIVLDVSDQPGIGTMLTLGSYNLLHPPLVWKCPVAAVQVYEKKCDGDALFTRSVKLLGIFSDSEFDGTFTHRQFAGNVSSRKVDIFVYQSEIIRKYLPYFLTADSGMQPRLWVEAIYVVA